MQEIQQSLAALTLGAPQVFRNLALFPLVSQRAAAAGYLLLVDGDELVGAKQNRILNLSILVAGGARSARPRGQGRWRD